jgi:hypothetical protein
LIEKTALIIMGLSLKLLCVDIEVEVKGVVPTLGQRVAHNRPRTISSIREMHQIKAIQTNLNRLTDKRNPRQKCQILRKNALLDNHAKMIKLKTLLKE